jgi:CheY-like chemotaxis protein
MNVTLLNHRRILVVDDNQAIHDDFRKILAAESGAGALDDDESALFGEPTVAGFAEQFEIDTALQGQEAIDLVQEGLRVERLYSVAFVDVRMPPGLDGIETVAKLWDLDPFLQVVICTAYSDYSWHEMVEELGASDRLLILKKPFDNVEVRQLAETLSEKWRLSVKQWADLQAMKNLCALRTNELDKAASDLVSIRELMNDAIRRDSDHLPSVCDEIRGVLQTVATRAEGLLDTTLSDSERQAATEAIIQEAKRGLGVIEYVRHASVDQSGETVLDTP